MRDGIILRKRKWVVGQESHQWEAKLQNHHTKETLNVVMFISKHKVDSILINIFNTEYRKTIAHDLRRELTKESEER